MNISQRFDFRKRLVPELKQSLHILALPLTDLKHLVDKELAYNPFLLGTELTGERPAARCESGRCYRFRPLNSRHLSLVSNSQRPLLFAGEDRFQVNIRFPAQNTTSLFRRSDDRAEKKGHILLVKYVSLDYMPLPRITGVRLP
jgi:DNA-directed RNA polymerase specialized sigma54-like protein